jgi:hypothetical protein
VLRVVGCDRRLQAAEAIQVDIARVLDAQRAAPLGRRGLVSDHFHVFELQVARPADLHGVRGLLQRRLRVVGDEQLDVVEADAIQPAMGMSVDQRRALPGASTLRMSTLRMNPAGASRWSD